MRGITFRGRSRSILASVGGKSSRSSLDETERETETIRRGRGMRRDGWKRGEVSRRRGDLNRWRHL